MRWRLLRVVPLVAILIGPLYARHDPDLLGIAFFYWYELACLLVSVTLTCLAFPARPERTAIARDDEPRFSRDPAIRRYPSRTLTRAG